MAKAKPKSAEKMSFAEILAAKQPAKQSVPICLDPGLAERRDELRRELGRAELRAGKNAGDESLRSIADALRVEFEEAEEAAEAMTVDFEFKALGRKVLEVIMKANRPTKAQIDKFQDDLEREGLPPETLTYDPDRFPPELISRSCTYPKMTMEEATEMWNSDQFSRGDTGALFQTAWQVNQIISR